MQACVAAAQGEAVAAPRRPSPTHGPLLVPVVRGAVYLGQDDLVPKLLRHLLDLRCNHLAGERGGERGVLGADAGALQGCTPVVVTQHPCRALAQCSTALMDSSREEAGAAPGPLTASQHTE